MAPDPALVAETKGWLEKALADLGAGEWELVAVPPFTADPAFHAQQAVEKSLKGFLTWHGRTFRKTHNLIELGEACAKIDAGLEPLLRRAATLTEYAFRFRYPGESVDPSVDEAKSALALARSVHDEILKRLPSDVRPQ